IVCRAIGARPRRETSCRDGEHASQAWWTRRAWGWRGRAAGVAGTWWPPPPAARVVERVRRLWPGRASLANFAAALAIPNALMREDLVRSILGLFAKSPFGPLAEHAHRVHETVVLIRPLVEAFIEGDWSRTQELYERISRLEHDADVLKNDIRDHLPKSLFLPVDRGDVLLFLREQDRVADSAEDLGVLLTMR